VLKDKRVFYLLEVAVQPLTLRIPCKELFAIKVIFFFYVSYYSYLNTKHVLKPLVRSLGEFVGTTVPICGRN
jgi:hypothetical protein